VLFWAINLLFAVFGDPAANDVCINNKCRLTANLWRAWSRVFGQTFKLICVGKLIYLIINWARKSADNVYIYTFVGACAEKHSRGHRSWPRFPCMWHLRVEINIINYGQLQSATKTIRSSDHIIRLVNKYINVLRSSFNVPNWILIILPLPTLNNIWINVYLESDSEMCYHHCVMTCEFIYFNFN